ncbi:hypothetical protein LTR46_006766 [Exophiala xenobiotica]|nr:hypothetical protein LTR46_006766 [Exophiala xenobiotica]
MPVLSRVLSIVLRVAELAFAAVVLGVTSKYLHDYRSGSGAPLARFIYVEVVAAISVLFALLWLLPFASGFFHWPVDLFLSFAWFAAFGLLVNYVNGRTNCGGNTFDWSGIRHGGTCGRWKSNEAFSFLSAIVWIFSGLVGLWFIHRERRKTVRATDGASSLLSSTSSKTPVCSNMAQDRPGLGDLVRLPREVRDLIYEHYFAGALVYQSNKYIGVRPKYVMRNMEKRLLDVSKAIRKEAEPHQYSNITLRILFEQFPPPEHLCCAASSVILESLKLKAKNGLLDGFLPFDAQRYKNLTTLHIRNTTLQSKPVRGVCTIELDDTKIKQYLRSGHHEDYILEAVREKWILFEEPLPVVNYHGPGLMVRTSVTARLTRDQTSEMGLNPIKYVSL